MANAELRRQFRLKYSHHSQIRADRGEVHFDHSKDIAAGPGFPIGASALHRLEPLARGRANRWGCAGLTRFSASFFASGQHSVSGAFRAWRYPAAFEPA